MSTKSSKSQPHRVPAGTRVAVVAARFNSDIVERLLSGCTKRLSEHGLSSEQITVHHVPGAFELPVAAKLLAATRRYGAIICLGAVIRGETPHFDYVAGECARGIATVSLSESLPVIFGVLTTNTEQQALDRCGGKHGHAGERAADAALEMVALARAIA